MEPFPIQCESCLAKLKVAKESLLGKQLPCPKCGAIVLVVTPDSSANETETGGDSESPNSIHFDDVDQLLAQPEAAKPKPRQRKTPAPSAPLTTPPATSDLGDQPWANPAAQKMRKTIAVTAAVIGGALILGAIVVAWTLNASTKTEVASNQLDQTAEVVAEVPSEETPPQPEPAPASPIENTAPEPQSPPTETTSAAPDVPAQPPEIAPQKKASVDLNQASPLGPDGSRSSTPDKNTTVDPIESAPVPGALRPISKLQSNLGELATLLNQAGTSITDISDATASLGNTDAIGLPKYYFERPTQLDVDLQKQLALPCDGLLYQQTSLANILRDISLITGVPISYDTQHLSSGTNDSRLLPIVDLKVSDLNFSDAVDQCVQPSGWMSELTPNGVLITLPNRNAKETRQYDLTPIAALGVEGIVGFVDTMQRLIVPEALDDQTQQTSVSRDGDELSITHTAKVHEQVQRFLDRTIASMELAKGNENPAFRTTLQRRLQTAATSLAQPCELTPTVRGSLDSLLVRIREKTDVDVIANWETLVPEGWTPTTSVPGDVSEPTLSETIEQIKRAMKISAVVIDPQTIELTSFQDASRRSYIEFYYVGELLERKFIPEHLMQLVREATGGAIGQRGSTMIYEPNCRSLIVLSPQATHQMIETILAKLQ